MRGYKNIASAAAADVCISPQRSSIVSTEPSTPPSGGRYSLRSYTQQQDAGEIPVAPVQVAQMTALGEGDDGSDEGGGGGLVDSERAHSEDESSEEDREIARLSELEASRRGVAPAPEEVRGGPVRIRFCFILSLHLIKFSCDGCGLVPLPRC